ncbi:MAG: hypothetical protein O4965_32725 [Trichodesmium sp. St19_bin1]|nr:hypothetical protein [Trichodesmium sp. St19_bin1]
MGLKPRPSAGNFLVYFFPQVMSFLLSSLQEVLLTAVGHAETKNGQVNQQRLLPK